MYKSLDFILDNIEKPKQSIIDLFDSGDIGLFNKTIFNSSYEDYKFLVEEVLQHFSSSLENNYKRGSLLSIRVFINIFSIFKKFDFKFSLSKYSVFINLCKTYDSIFLGGENIDDLENWVNLVYKYINSEISYLDLAYFDNKKFLDSDKQFFEIFVSDYVRSGKDIYEDFDVIQLLVGGLRELYSLARDGKNIDLDYLDNFISVFINREFDSSIYYRLLSIMSFRNDYFFQFIDIDNENILRFSKDVDYIYNNNLYDGGSSGETAFKVIEMYGKIRFASNIIKNNSSYEIYHIYKNCIKNTFPRPHINKKDYFHNMFLYQMEMTLKTLSLFEPEFSLEKFFTTKKITKHWRIFKHRYHKGVVGFLIRKKDGIFSNRYNFI